MRKFILIFALIILPLSVFGQSITWQKQYDGPAHFDDYGGSICRGDGENFYIGGTTYSMSLFGRPYIIKINKYGDTLWTRVLSSGKVNEFCGAITRTSDEGCIAACDSLGRGYIVKFDSNGNLLWKKKYNTQGNTLRIKKIVETSNKGFVVTGESGFRGFLLTADSLGNLIWFKLFSSNNLKRFMSVVETWDNSFLVSGYYQDNFTDTTKTVIMKVNNSGDSVWQKIYTFYSGKSYGAQIIYNKSNIYLGCFGDIGSFMAKIDTTGNLIDTNIINYASVSQLSAFKIRDNRIISSDYDTGSNDTITARLNICNLNGKSLYRNIIKSVDYIALRDIAFADNGGYFICWRCRSYPNNKRE